MDLVPEPPASPRPPVAPGADRGVAPPDDPTGLRKRIPMLYKNLLMGVSFGTLAAVTILAPMTLQGPLPDVVAMWAVATFGWLAVGFALYGAYRHANREGTASTRLWALLSTAGGGIAGLVWGSLGFCVLVPEVRPFEPLIVTALCLLSLGAALGYAVYLPAMIAFSVGVVLPLGGSFLVQGDAAHIAMAILALQFTAALIAFGVEFNRALVKEFELNARVSQLARDLDREKAQVVAASEAKSRFLASASHDLRQPVHSINLYVGALARFVAGNEGRQVLTRLDGSVRALDGLFDSIQDISKMDAGAVTVTREAFRLDALFDALDYQMRAAAEVKGLALVFEPTDAVVSSDRVLLSRMLANLISNAIRYTPSGTVTIRARSQGRSVAIAVEDTGIGIPEDKREAVFEEFVQLGNPERDRSKGLGLGLAIVRKLGGLLGHAVACESQVGKGSVFTVTVPAVDTALVVTPALQTEASGTLHSLAGAFVLVVDDETDILLATEIILQQAGCHVLTATSGDDAIDKLAREDRMPDVVVSDLRLRNHESGIDVVRRVSAFVDDRLPAILVTGDTAPERIAEAAASGLPLLHKPVRPAELLRALSRAIDDRQQGPFAAAS